MKENLKKYLFITIFIISIAFAGIVNAENKVVNNTTDSNKNTNTTNKTVNNTTTNTTTNKTVNNTTTNNTNKTTTSTTTKSNNANLSTMGVSPKEYDFTGFNKNKTSYNVTVPNNIDSLKVVYKTEHSKAKVSVTGNNDLEVGSNTIKVVVTAEDGKTKKTYTIKVTKLATEDSKPGNLIDDDSNDLVLKSLSIKGLELTPEFKKNVYSYEATIDMDTNDMSEVEVKAEVENKNATVEITGNTNLEEGENVVNVIVKSNSSSEQTVYQITVNKVSKASEVASGKKIRKEHIIIGAFVIASIIAIIIIIKINKGKKKIDEYNEYNDDYEDDDMSNKASENNLNENFIEDLYKRRSDGQRLNRFEEETIEDIEKENDRIFGKAKKSEMYNYEKDNKNETDEFLEELRRKSKGKHF